MRTQHETALLAATVNGANPADAEYISEQSFYYEPNGAIWSALVELHDEGIQPEPTAIMHKLGVKAHQYHIDEQQLRDLFTQDVSSSDIGALAKPVAEPALRRKLTDIAYTIYAASETDEPYEDVYDTALEALEELPKHFANQGKPFITAAGAEIKVTRASDIKPKRQKWLYKPADEGVIPLQTGTVFAGAGGEGKSSFALHIAAMLSRGDLPGDLYGTKGQTIIFGPEDDWETAMVPRLMAATADLDQVLQVTAETLTPYGTMERELKFPLDIRALEQVVIHNSVKLIVVDPISTSMDGDLNKVQDVRDAMGALISLAQKYDLAVIVINHFNKSGQGVANRMSGSHALRDVVRSYLAFGTDDETGERIITQDKANYSRSTASWKFVLQNTEVQTDDGTAEVPAVQMLGASDVTVGDLLDREHDEGQDDDRKDWESWLIEMLTEAGGSMASKEIERAANAVGFNFKRIQKDRPKIRNPRVETGRTGYGPGAKYVWQIEEDGPVYSSRNTMDSVYSMYPNARETMETMETMEDKPESMTPHTGQDEPDQMVFPSEPSKPSCSEHGTNYAVSVCTTCRQFAKEAA